MGQQEPIRVLSVDDDDLFVEVLGEFLEREDECLSVTTATSAHEGLTFLSEHEFDCVISDFEMPEMNGLEFLHAVRQRGDDLPFIMFTGRSDDELASRAISAGVTDYLQKEVGTDQYSVLAELVRDSVL